MSTHFPPIDYLFAGAGASATLMLMRLEKYGLLENKSVLILDPDAKTEDDKTYCFWSDPNKQPALDCKHLISHRWSDISINQKPAESMMPQAYHHISGLDVYKELRRIVEDHKLNRLQGGVLKIKPNKNNLTVISDIGTWEAKMVFDSRPPEYSPLKKEDAHLIQSFLGFVITTEAPLMNDNCVDLMDFGIDQQGETQFIYVLPFEKNKALVELTRFGSATIEPSEAEPILLDYIEQRYGQYEIVSKEIGRIPMSTATIANYQIPGVIPIGARAGAVKPSTGYAFKNMFDHADRIAMSLLEKTKSLNIQKSKRFNFYDRLLLLILSQNPSQGKVIFEALFKKNKTKNILSFLDEKTNIFEDIRIFLSLPFKPFLLAVWWVVIAKLRRIKPHQALIPLSIALLIAYTAVPYLFNYIQIILFTLGLLAIGIPHGAVDHLLENGHYVERSKAGFILHYLSLAGINLVCWIYFPLYALVFFLLYSAWHFGQTDMQEWHPEENSPFKNIAWGCLLLSIILCGHTPETNHILENLSIQQIPFNNLEGKIISVVLSIMGIAWSLLTKRRQMLFSVLMLAISIQLPLITSFGLYFIGQHSLNGWAHLKKGMNLSNRLLYRKALPFTLGALVLFMLLGYSVKHHYLIQFKEHWLSIFFVFISCISFPHVMAMSKFYQKRESIQST